MLWCHGKLDQMAGLAKQVRLARSASPDHKDPAGGILPTLPGQFSYKRCFLQSGILVFDVPKVPRFDPSWESIPCRRHFASAPALSSATWSAGCPPCGGRILHPGDRLWRWPSSPWRCRRLLRDRECRRRRPSRQSSSLWRLRSRSVNGKGTPEGRSGSSHKAGRAWHGRWVGGSTKWSDAPRERTRLNMAPTGKQEVT